MGCIVCGMNENQETRIPHHDRARRRPDGPHPGIIAAVCLGLFVASLVTMAALSHGGTLSSPFSDDSADFYTRHGLAVRISAWLQLGSSVPLGIYAATMSSRLQRLGMKVPGPVIALFGGASASIMLALSAILTWTAGQDDVAALPELSRALGFIAFGTGGFAHVLGLGLLVAGIAVPSLIRHLLPTPLAWAGLVIAALCELTVLAMVIEPLQPLIPIGRFSALIWIVAAGFLMPRTRHQRNTTKETP
jgi:hypothetical protein